MRSPALDTHAFARVKNTLLTLLPDQPRRSSFVDEALASGFGFRTYASFRAAVADDPKPTFRLLPAAFAERYADFDPTLDREASSTTFVQATCQDGLQAAIDVDYEKLAGYCLSVASERQRLVRGRPDLAERISEYPLRVVPGAGGMSIRNGCLVADPHSPFDPGDVADCLRRAGAIVYQLVEVGAGASETPRRLKRLRLDSIPKEKKIAHVADAFDAEHPVISETEGLRVIRHLAREGNLQLGEVLALSHVAWHHLPASASALLVGLVERSAPRYVVDDILAGWDRNWGDPDLSGPGGVLRMVGVVAAMRNVAGSLAIPAMAKTEEPGSAQFVEIDRIDPFDVKAQVPGDFVLVHNGHVVRGSSFEAGPGRTAEDFDPDDAPSTWGPYRISSVEIPEKEATTIMSSTNRKVFMRIEDMEATLAHGKTPAHGEWTPQRPSTKFYMRVEDPETTPAHEDGMHRRPPTTDLPVEAGADRAPRHEGSTFMEQITRWRRTRWLK